MKINRKKIRPTLKIKSRKKLLNFLYNLKFRSKKENTKTKTVSSKNKRKKSRKRQFIKTLELILIFFKLIIKFWSIFCKIFDIFRKKK